MNPSPDAVAAIRSRVVNWDVSDADIAADLNQPTEPNPTPRPLVAKPFDSSDALALIGSPSVRSILSLPSFETTIRPLLDAHPKDAKMVGQLVRWAAALAKAGILTPEEYAALAAPAPGIPAGAPVGLFQRTEAVPDPAWPPTLSWAALTLGRPADPDDIAAARPGEEA